MSVKEPYKYEPHSFTGRVVGRQYCVRCGLVALNNQFTSWCIRMGCNNEGHPNYNSQRRKTGCQ